MTVFLFAGNTAFAASVVPNDPLYVRQWYLKKIGADEAWQYTQGSSGVIVAVLDSGVDIEHPDLRENIWRNTGEIAGDGLDNDGNGYADDVNGWDFVSGVADPRPKFEEGFTDVGIYHGTAIASIISSQGNNFEGIAGVTWRSSIMPLRVIDAKGNGTEDKVIEGLRYAIRNGADVVNMSFVGLGNNETFRAVLREAYDAGIIVVAAAGNERQNGQSGKNLDVGEAFPVCYDDEGKNLVLGVAATNENDVKGVFSNYGAKCIDVSAPGTDFVTAAAGDKALGLEYGYLENWSGTSLAAPLVSGVAALLQAKYRDISVAEIQQAILGEADSIADLNIAYAGQLGVGRLNVARIFEALENPNALRFGDLVKASGSAVYYYSDGKRYVFPNEKTFFTRYKDFSGVKTITDAELAAIPLGKNMTYRAGSRLITFTTDRTLYAVEEGGVLRALVDDAEAVSLFGVNWKTFVDEVPDVFFTDYRLQ